MTAEKKMIQKKMIPPTAAELAKRISKSGKKAKAAEVLTARRAAKAQTEQERPELVSCPVCFTAVDQTDVNPGMVAPPVDDPEVHRDIVERRISRAARRGFFEDAAAMGQVADREVRTAAEEEPPQPRPGLDQCPACGAEDVAVDESRLTSTGRRALHLSRSEGVENIRRAKAEKSETTKAVLAHNAKAKALRDAERATRSRYHGGGAA